ncbi:hypothetical protein [Vibrio mediterranei]|uniref:hypothetical protein n=1 Tax=Vibrio mediterranei TaxID=689 RepID=UPI0040696845
MVKQFFLNASTSMNELLTTLSYFLVNNPLLSIVIGFALYVGAPYTWVFIHRILVAIVKVYFELKLGWRYLYKRAKEAAKEAIDDEVEAIKRERN